MKTSIIQTDAEIFSDVISRDNGDFDPDAARAILRLHFSDRQNDRMRELADRNNRGELTEDEQQVMESFRRVGNFLALLQAKARLSLKLVGDSDRSRN